MVVVPRPFPSSVLAAGHKERVRRRSSGLGGVWIRVCAMHGRALILGVLRLRAVQELVVAMFLIFFVFVMRFRVAGPLLHGTARRLLVWHL